MGQRARAAKSEPPAQARLGPDAVRIRSGCVGLQDREWEGWVTIQDAIDVRTVERKGTVSHRSLPGFALRAHTLFDEPRPKRHVRKP